MHRLDFLRAFAAVVETGSFTAAARRLGLSKALVSKHVGQLEESLGVRLLNRTTRAVQPTEAGQETFRRSRRILDEVADLEEAVHDPQGAVRGHLRIAGPRVFGEDTLVPCAAAFMIRHPAVTLELALEERRVDLVAEGFDLGVRIGELADSGLIARRIAAYRYVLCATPAYLAAAGTPLMPGELAGHAALVNAVITPDNRWEFRVDGRRTVLTVAPRARVNTAGGVRDLALAGHGIGFCLLPNVAADLEAGRLVRLLEAYEAYDRSVHAVYPHARLLPAKVRAFLDHLVAWCQPADGVVTAGRPPV